jgi:hypothetical protein
MSSRRRVALVWRDTPTTREEQSDRFGFAATAEALQSAGLEPEPCLYAEEREAEVEAQLGTVDAVLVWVNPIHEGRDRRPLDALLARVAERGVLVSAHPRAIQAIGTKEVLHRTRAMPWGANTRLYRSVEAMAAALPSRLGAGEARVLKQNRGHSGIGIWRIERGADSAPGPEMIVRVRHAPRGRQEEVLTLSAFLARGAGCFAEGGMMLEQPYAHRLPEGMIRCYLVGDRIEGFGHQAIHALHPPPPGAPADAAPEPGPRLYSGPDDPRFQHLRRLMHGGWVAQLLAVSGLARTDLPLLWDADFLLGAKGPDTSMLCEMNVSSVSPFPDSVLVPLATEVGARLRSRSG